MAAVVIRICCITHSEWPASATADRQETPRNQLPFLVIPPGCFTMCRLEKEAMIQFNVNNTEHRCGTPLGPTAAVPLIRMNIRI
jgi:hypothetical protein